MFADSAPNRILLPFVHFSFALCGITTTLLGVILPALSARFALTDADSGAFFLAQAVGAVLGTYFSEKLWTRIGFLPTIAGGLLLSIAGFAALESFGLAGAAFGVFLNGGGTGLTIPTTNLFVAARTGEKSAAALNLLNFSWTCGALVCPAFFAALGAGQSVGVPLLLLSILLFLNALLFVIIRRAAPLAQVEKENQPLDWRFWKSPLAILTAAAFFAYLGAENGLGGWLPTFALRVEPDAAAWRLPLMSVFWLFFLSGRLVAPLVLRRVGEEKFLIANCVIAAAGAAVILLSFNPVTLACGAALAAFGLAPVFPTALARFIKSAGADGARQAKWLFVSGTLGGAFFSWLIGVLASALGSLRGGLVVVLGCVLLLILLHLALARRRAA